MSEKLTIIQQNDTHGQLESHMEFFRDFRGSTYRMVGGFPRIKSFIKKVREQNENVLFIDSGDLFHGTGPLVLSSGEVMPQILNEMSIDAFVPGNWEFAYGPEQLVSLTRQLNFPTVSANLNSISNQEPLFHSYVIKEFHKLKVGIVGLTYPY